MTSQTDKNDTKTAILTKTDGGGETMKVDIIDKKNASFGTHKDKIQIKLSFPKHWPIKKHPENSKLTDDIVKWLKEMKLINTTAEEILVRNFELSGYGGYCQPEGE